MRSSPWSRLGLLAACGVGSVALAAAPPSYPTPEAAVQALVDAARAGDSAKVVAVLGGGAKPLVESGDAVAEHNAHERFVGLYDEDHALIPEGDDRRILQIGATQWPFPIPVVKGKAGWSWDSSAGVAELLARRIGQNELNAIQVCLAISDAENEYLTLNPQNASPPHYADKFISSTGKRDGLYWPTTEGEPPSPLGPGAARATSEGYKLEQGKPAPFHGYMYRILSAQGPHAEGGAVSYLVKGVLYGGFALVGYPAEYRKSGVMTFIVNHHGVVFQKDLGQDTASKAKAMKAFEPDSTWTQVP